MWITMSLSYLEAVIQVYEDITKRIVDYIGINDADPLQGFYWESSQQDLYKVFTEELVKHNTIQLILKDYNANTSQHSTPDCPIGSCP